MGKCVRIRGSSKPRAAAAAAASCLTPLCSGRRVPPSEASSACSPRTRSRPRRHRGAGLRRWCGAKESAYGGSPRRRRRGEGEADARSPRGRVLGVGGARQQQLCADGHGQQHEEEASATMAGDCDDDAGVAKVNKANKHENDECRCRVVVGVASQTPSPSPPTETEIEAFFADAELAERRRFAEAYNYDVALDRPLEGRFEWVPLPLTGGSEGVKPSQSVR